MTHRNDAFDKDETIADVEDRISSRLPEAPAEIVHEEAVVAVEKYADAPVKDFVDIIAEREARAAVEESLQAD